MRLIKLTHANLNQPVDVVAELVAFYYKSPGNACTHVVASGGAIFPAKETVEEIRQLLVNQERAKEAQTNGNEKS